MSVGRKFTIANRGLRYKLLLAFTLMSLIPLLAAIYIVSTYLFPTTENMLSISLIMITCLVIAILGLYFARGLVDPVINMAVEASLIASGNYDKDISVSGEDEIGNLAISINSMTQKIKTNMEELKSYSQRIRDINMDIRKKVLVLSSLLQIGDIISSGSMRIDSLLEMAVEKASTVFDTGFGALYMPNDKGDFIAKITYNLTVEQLKELVLKEKGGGVLEKLFETHQLFIMDKNLKPSKDIEQFKQSCNLMNMLAIPILSGRHNLALLVVGNRIDDFKYKNEDIDLVKVFAKQLAIAIESNLLNLKAEGLAIKDDLTDLYNKNFILPRLEEEIKRAIFYQRPCSFIAFSIDDFASFRQLHGELQTEEALRRIAKIVKDNTTPVGKAARVAGDEFAILLPEKNKREAARIAEEIKSKIESTNLLRDGRATVKISGGVSENPIDGTTADELFKKALEGIKEAKTSGDHKIIV